MIPDVIQALSDHWDDIAGRLNDHDRRALAGPVRELLSAEDAAAQHEAALDIVEIVAPLLPADHPVRRVLATESTKLGRGVPDWSRPPGLLLTRLAAFVLPPLLADRTGSAADELAGPMSETAQDVRQRAEEWLMAAPAVDAGEARRRGVDPDGPGLIRLAAQGSGPRMPEFQFDATGQPYAVVTRINLLLDADGDPWGVADWWLGPNAWIGAIPAEMIGRIDDQVLIEAASAVLEVG